MRAGEGVSAEEDLWREAATQTDVGFDQRSPSNVEGISKRLDVDRSAPLSRQPLTRRGLWGEHLLLDVMRGQALEAGLPPPASAPQPEPPTDKTASASSLSGGLERKGVMSFGFLLR